MAAKRPHPDDDEVMEFHEMGLDDRILGAIAQLKWKKPTLIQEKVIPLALEGKDILARARTGTGKTACFLLPVIQKILEKKRVAKEQKIRALIMTPSKELCNQAFQNIKSLTSCCAKEVRALDISGQVSLQSQKPLLMDRPDIVVGTPSKILAHVKAGNLQLRDSIEMVVVDEADLVFSFGYETDMKTLLSFFPKIYQAFLMSATLSEDVKSIKKMILHNPVTVKLEESNLPDTAQLTQYHIKCEDTDKFILLYTLIKLNLVQGKCIVFVNNIARCYQLKLFLGHLGIEACVLNPELPINSRVHIVEQFNQGFYDVIIGSDDTNLDEDLQRGASKKKAKKSGKSKEEYGISRGIDFQFVSNVINFDFPTSSQAYIHRVGRTARGKNKGAALSFVSIKEMELFHKLKEELASDYSNVDAIFQPFNFKMSEIEGFRYRAMDAFRATTSTAVRQARLAEIKKEMLTSDRLKTYFEENPRDKQILRHDAATGVKKLQAHLKNVPEYIIPEALKARASVSKPKRSAVRKMKQTQKFQKKHSDALKSFKLQSISGGKGKRGKK